MTSTTDITKAIWVVKPRSQVLHVIPEQKFMPALCGMVPPGKGMTVGKWSIVNSDSVAKVAESGNVSGRKFCEKCLKSLTDNINKG